MYLIDSDRVKQRIIRLNRQIRALIHKHKRSYDVTRIAASEVKVGYLNGQKIERVILILRSRGCQWALGNSGGCTMCGMLAGTTLGEEISHEAFLTQFLDQFNSFNFVNYPMLCVYNSGSFFNEKELPVGTRRAILERLATEKEIKAVVFESRPEFITKEVLEEVSYYLGDRRVEVGIGLESANEEVLNICLNKGFSKDDYKATASLIKGTPIKLLTYVLIKPPFLTEAEGMADAIETAEFAFNCGTDVVSFEPLSVQNFTLVHYLHEARVFRPPWIWSVIEVAKYTIDKGFARLGGFEFMPIPKIFTHNCDRCNPKAVAAIDEFNSSNNISVFNDLDCACREDWEFDLSQKAEPLLKRIEVTLDRIDEQAVLSRMPIFRQNGEDRVNSGLR